MRRNLGPNDRLIVAADFASIALVAPARATFLDDVFEETFNFARKLRGLNIYIKLNSILRAIGYRFIGEIHANDLRVFADLKLNDIPNTLSADGRLIRQSCPEILTIMCTAGKPGVTALKKTLPQTELLGVTVLTSFREKDAVEMFNTSTKNATIRLAKIGKEAGLDGVVCAPSEIRSVRSLFGSEVTITVPNIRVPWADVHGDDQDPGRTMTPEEAIKAGADRIIVGRPITCSKDPRAAVERILEEINSAL